MSYVREEVNTLGIISIYDPYAHLEHLMPVVLIPCKYLYIFVAVVQYSLLQTVSIDNLLHTLQLVV